MPTCRHTIRRSRPKSPVTSPAFRLPTTPTFIPATSSRQSTTATTGSPSNSAREKVATQRSDHRADGSSDRRAGSCRRAGKTQLVSARRRGQTHRAGARSPEPAWSRATPQAANCRNRRRRTATRRWPASRARRPRSIPRRQCGRAQGPAAGGDLHTQRTQDRARQGRARSILYRYSRAARRRDRQSRRADRRLRADRPAACEPRSAGRGICHRQFQGDAGRATQARTAGLDCGRCASRTPINGTVESFSPASGAVFSLLPPDNATGNFTKIVQRLPVRIHVPAEVAAKDCCVPACRSW